VIHLDFPHALWRRRVWYRWRAKPPGGEKAISRRSCAGKVWPETIQGLEPLDGLRESRASIKKQSLRQQPAQIPQVGGRRGIGRRSLFVSRRPAALGDRLGETVGEAGASTQRRVRFAGIIGGG